MHMTEQPQHEPIWHSEGLSFEGSVPAGPVDVCIIGAGVAGMSVAYNLVRQGVRPLVLDDGPVGGGQTSCTTAHLASILDDRFSNLERVRGPQVAALAYQAHATAVDFIEKTCSREGIDCDFHRLNGFLFAPAGKPSDELDKEEQAARRAGAQVERLLKAPFPGNTGPCLRFARQGRSEPLRYLAGLAQVVREGGGQIVTGKGVDRLRGGASPWVQTRDGQRISARSIVVATNSPINDRVVIHTRQAPYMTYVVALDLPEPLGTDGLFWDTEDPYHYVREARGEGGRPVLLVGGEDHRTGLASNHEERWARLEAWARQLFPQVGKVQTRWAGQVMETLDGLAYIGPNPRDENVFVVTGDSGMGMTHGTIAGLLLPDLITGHDHPWAGLFDPARQPLGTLGSYLYENARSAWCYADWIRPGEVSSTSQIPRGSGAVIRHGLSKQAVYRDEDGQLHICSAACPHLGGVVHWNEGEKTWDCPLHGSRFDAEGHVLNGPAAGDLQVLRRPRETAST